MHTTFNTLLNRLFIKLLYMYDVSSYTQGAATCHIYPLPIFSLVKLNPVLRIRRHSSVGRHWTDDLEIAGSSPPLFFTNIVRLVAYVFKDGDPQLVLMTEA